MARTIRIEAEQRKKSGGPITCLRSGVQAFFYRGEAVLFEIGLLSNGVQVQKADITTLTIRFRNASGTLLSETIVSNSSLSAGLTAQQWRQGNAALARVSFSTSATSGLPAGMLTMEIVAGDVVFLSGTIESATSAAVTPGDPPAAPVDDYYTKEEADATFEPLGASVANAATILEITEYLGGDTEGVGAFVMATAQSWTAAERKQARLNIGAMAREEGQELSGDPADVTKQAINDQDGGMTIFAVDANTEFNIRSADIRQGVPYLVSIQQGRVAHWAPFFKFPPNEITFGNSTGDFAKKTWHPVTGESPAYDYFEIISEGSAARVRRMLKAAVPDSCIDWMAESPFMTHNGSVFTAQTDRHGRTTISGSAGTPLYSAMAGSNFRGVHYDGTAAQSFAVDVPVIAQGYAVAGVFTAAISTGQRVLFTSDALGIKIVADTDGIRLQAFAGASGSGLLISTAYNTVPIAFVAVVRPDSGGAYVLTTDATGGGQTGSFTPTTPVAGGYGRFGWGTGTGNALNCKIARFQIFRSGLNPDQARGVLDSLTSYYQLG